MIPSHSLLRLQLARLLSDMDGQGHDIRGLEERLSGLPASLDALADFARELQSVPLRADWPFVEPDSWAEIQAELSPQRPRGNWRSLEPGKAQRHVEIAFLSSVCGCVLGKPVEVAPDLAQLRRAGEETGEWPLRDYVTEKMLDALGQRHPSWMNTVRERIRFVEPDDDINYTLMGMLVLEQFGAGFSQAELRGLWLHHLTLGTTWGPERTMLARAALNHLAEGTPAFEPDPASWAAFLNPGSELCGAQIRADAYGYAAAGSPELAAQLAWRDASWTHRKTGVYATMWTAAAIAAAPVAKNPLEIFEIANQFVPQNSRFHQAAAFALDQVRASSSWQDGYERLRTRYGSFGHCRVLFESGTLINTLRWAGDIGDGLCLQVMQGNDTDSYGATAGSMLGMFLGPGYLEGRWLAPFGDDLHTALAWFFDRSLAGVARRISDLPRRLAQGPAQTSA